MEELWENISDFEDRYQVSNYGNIKSLDFKDILGRVRKGRILKPTIDKGGYLRVRISKNDLKKSFRIHRLVAIHFISNPEDLPQVNHIDGDKQNNLFSNLEWCDNSHNQKHAIEHGLRTIEFGEKSRAFKGVVYVKDKLGNIIHELQGSRHMKSLGFDPRNVSACVNGKRKTYKGFTYERE